MEIDLCDESFETVPEAQRESIGFAAAAKLSSDDEDDDHNSFVTATMMDVDSVGDENQSPSPTKEQKAAKGVTIVVESGPHKGSAVNLIEGHCETIVVGRDPETKAGEGKLVLSSDDELGASHIRMTLSMTRKLTGVVVADLRARGGVFVGSDKIRRGGDWKIFRGSTVRLGQTMLRVSTLDANKVSSTATTTGSKSSRTTKPKTVSKPQQVTKAPPKLKRRGVRIAVVEGPHKGETHELEKGLVESISVGSKPSGGATMKLSKDRDLKATHVKIELKNSSKMTAVNVTDKSKGGTKVNKNQFSGGFVFINDRIYVGNSVLEVQVL